MGLSPNVVLRAEAQEEKALIGTQTKTQKDTAEAQQPRTPMHRIAFLSASPASTAKHRIAFSSASPDSKVFMATNAHAQDCLFISLSCKHGPAQDCLFISLP